MAAALSGGGHRASLWGLGALAYIVDARLSDQLVSVASVSGGSITNGVLAASLDVRTASASEFDRAASRLARHIAFEGIVPARATAGYLVALTAATLAGAAAPWVAPATVATKALATPWTAAAVGAAAAGGRGRVVDAAMAKAHFSRDGRPLLLRDVDRTADHIFCATELQSGDHFYMSPRSVYGYSFGVGAPADLQISTAVQCSAALPGAFPPRWLATGRHALAHPVTGSARTDVPSHLVLTDGGVYDNMADQWQVGFMERARRWPNLVERHEQADFLVVVNASAGWRGLRPMRTSRVPGVADIQGLLRAKDVMYDVATGHRRYAMIDRFDAAEAAGQGLTGALVHIAQTPLSVARRAVDDVRAPEPRKQRARQVLARHDGRGAQWEAQRDRSVAAPTVLRRMGREATVDLLHHAYTLAMLNLHVVLGAPMLELPSHEDVATRFLGIPE